MKKRVLAIIMCAAMIATVGAGCGSSGAASGGDAPASEPAASAGGEASTAAPASGDVITLKVQSQDPEGSATGQFLETWAAAVEEESGGRLDVNVFHGGSLGPATESYNMVVNGTVDLAWGLPSMTTGRFPLTDVAALPFTAEDTLQASYALEDLYETTDFLKDEWSEVKVILLHTNCDSPLLLKGNKVEKYEDLKGRQLRFAGGNPTTFADKAGAVPTTMAMNDIYTNLEKGVVDGAANCGWDAIASFNLYEQADYILDWSMNVNPYFFVMNNDSYNNLPDDLRAVIDKYSGLAALDFVGTKWQEKKAEMLEKNADKLYKWDDSEQAKADENAAQVIADWCASVDNGDELYAAWLERLEKYSDKIAQ